MRYKFTDTLARVELGKVKPVRGATRRRMRRVLCQHMPRRVDVQLVGRGGVTICATDCCFECAVDNSRLMTWARELHGIAVRTSLK